MRLLAQAFLLFSIAAATLLQPARAADDVVHLYYQARITIAADGTLQSLAWGTERKLPDFLREKLEARVRDWQFEPGRIDGVPAETESTLRLRLTATPLDGGEAYQVVIDNAETGPAMGIVPAPAYPREALRRGAEAQLLAEVRVDADGTRHVSLPRYEGQGAFRKLFEAAALPTFEDAAIHPERVGGHAVAARFAVPMSFCLNSGCDMTYDMESDQGTSVPTTAPGAPVPVGSVARLVTDVRGTAI